MSQILVLAQIPHFRRRASRVTPFGLARSGAPDDQLGALRTGMLAFYADDPRAVAIAEATRRLVELRNCWLNPPEWVEWVEWVDDPVPGYPQRSVACGDAAAKELKARTLTNLYNARPQWLADAHAALDIAVAAAYGWDAGISEEEVLRNLLALNLILWGLSHVFDCGDGPVFPMDCFSRLHIGNETLKKFRNYH